MELGATVCTKTPKCEKCPWKQHCKAYAQGDFTVPDVPDQPEFEGSRRQFRGRIVALLTQDGDLDIDELGYRLRADYTPQNHRDWLEELVDDLVEDKLVERVDGKEVVVIQLKE